MNNKECGILGILLLTGYKHDKVILDNLLCRMDVASEMDCFAAGLYYFLTNKSENEPFIEHCQEGLREGEVKK